MDSWFAVNRDSGEPVIFSLNGIIATNKGLEPSGLYIPNSIQHSQYVVDIAPITATAAAQAGADAMDTS